jgi:hypothetical protein
LITAAGYAVRKSPCPTAPAGLFCLQRNIAHDHGKLAVVRERNEHAASSQVQLHIECAHHDCVYSSCTIRVGPLMLAPTSNVAILGFGARAARFAALLAPRGCALRAWDPALASADGSAMRARIEAAGVDCMADIASALRGARLVVLDTMPMHATLAAQLQQGQQLLDLDHAAASDIDAVLTALGLPASAPRWESSGATAAPAMANSAATNPPTPLFRRGELP